MSKWVVIGGAALAVVLLVKAAQARAADPYNVRNWDYLPGYKPGSGMIA